MRTATRMSCQPRAAARANWWPRPPHLVGLMRRAAGRPAVGAARPPRAPPRPPAPAERLQKVLARAGLASRREAEGWIRAGRLTVNGKPATLGARVTPGDQVRLDGRLVRAESPVAGGARVPVPPLAGGAAAHPARASPPRVHRCRGRVCSSGCRVAPGGAS